MASPRALLFCLSQGAEFWYVIYHALFWLDLYLEGSAEGFAPSTSPTAYFMALSLLSPL